MSVVLEYSLRIVILEYFPNPVLLLSTSREQYRYKQEQQG